MNPQIRIFSVDDHPLLREGIAALVNSQPDMVIVGEASTGGEALQLYKQLQPDVTLLDLRLPDMSGIDTLIAPRRRRRPTPGQPLGKAENSFCRTTLLLT